MSKHVDTTRPCDAAPMPPMWAPPPLDWWHRLWIGMGALAMAGVVVIVCLTIYSIAKMPVAEVTEDSPEWDCATMGNYRCVPTPPVISPVHPEPKKL